MTTEAQKVKGVYTFHAITDRLEILKKQRILDKLRDGEPLRGNWGKLLDLISWGLVHLND